MIGTTVGPYRLTGQLGAGGMGVVYVAEDTRLGRQVAVKFLPASALGSADAMERFRLEARAASALSHPGICAIHDIGMHDGAPFMVMELVKGETLRERIGRGPMKIADVLDIGIQLADALATAHAQGIVHRDIKPANIVVDDKLRPKLLDFGLAKFSAGRIANATPDDITMAGGMAHHGTGMPSSPLTMAGTTLGTVAYMSPEQARGEEVDARTDIFSLGVVVYEMVTGQQAFSGSTTAVVFDAILNRAPVSPSVLKPDTPPRLVDAINTALEKDRSLRYQHAEELEAELKRIRRDLQSGATGVVSRAATVVPPIPVSAPVPVVPAVPPLPPPPVSPAEGLASAIAGAAVVAGAAAATSATGSAPYVSLPSQPPAARVGRSLWRRVRSMVWVSIGLSAALTGVWNPWRGFRNATSISSTTADSDRALQRLRAKDYRAALAEAEAVLADDPEDDDAIRVKTDATEMLRAVNALVESARRAHASGDAAAAARALAEAEALAPGDTAVTELSVLVRSTAVAPPAAPGTTAPPAPPPAGVRDEPELRRVLDVYRRSIATRDFDLFRSVYPDLAPGEEQRFRAAVGPGGPQPLVMRVEQLTVTGGTAEAHLIFLDPSPSVPMRPRLAQTVLLARRDGVWVITQVGPPRRRARPQAQPPRQPQG